MSEFLRDFDRGLQVLEGVSPRDLPSGGNATPPFNVTAGFSADSDPPAQLNGVNPGETLGIVFDLQAGKTYNDVITDLFSGDLRLGLHVQGFATGNSETFVNTPPIPEPTSLILLGLGLAGDRRGGEDSQASERLTVPGAIPSGWPLRRPPPR